MKQDLDFHAIQKYIKIDFWRHSVLIITLKKKALLHDGGGAGDGGAVKEVVDQSVVCGQGLER